MAIDTKGKVLFTDFSRMSKKEMDEQATVFAEGSNELKKILLLLWECGVQTIGCCGGHEDNKSMPYVAFNIEDMDSEEVKNILIQLAHNPKGVKQVTYTAGTVAKYPIYDKEGNIVGEQERHRPATLNMLIEENFEKSDVFKLLYSSLIEEEKQNMDGLNRQDKEWIENILKLKNIRLEDLNFYDYVLKNTSFKRLQGLDANVTQIGISRDSEGIEYIDNYALNYERVEPQYRKDARQMNMYIGLIPTGRIIERVQDRIKYYKTISEFKKEEKEPEQ